MTAKKKNMHSDSYAKNQVKSEISLVSSLLNIITSVRDQLIVRLFAETGCISKELVTIKNKDVDYKNNLIKINIKNKNQRSIFISKELVLDLKKFSDKNKEYLFVSKENAQLGTRSIRKLFDKYSKILGVKITSRDLRNAYIRESIKEKKSTETIKQNIGIKRLDKKKYLTKSEFEIINNSIKNIRDKLLLNIAFDTGCTLKELVAIKVEDIEFTNNSLAFNTQKKQRTSNISKKLSLDIKQYVLKNKLDKKNFLFSTRQSESISDKRVFQIIKKYALESDINEVSPKILRYSHIAHSISTGISVDDLSNQIGIKNLHKIYLYGYLGVSKKFTYKKNED